MPFLSQDPPPHPGQGGPACQGDSPGTHSLPPSSQRGPSHAPRAAEPLGHRWAWIRLISFRARLHRLPNNARPALLGSDAWCLPGTFVRR